MRSNERLTIFCVSILAVLILTLDADGEDLKCDLELKVKRSTCYETFVGENFTLNCTVSFCNSSPPTVSWMKLEQKSVPVNVSSGSHIKTSWKTSSHSEGISFLIFTNILSKDSGQYQCHTGGSVSHSISVSVHDDVQPSTATWMTLKPENMTQDSSQINVYCVVGIMVFVILAVAVYVTPKPACKGVTCLRKPRPKTDPDPENRVSGSNPGSSSSV